MEIKEIIESGFFKALLSNYVDYYASYHYNDHDRLIYALCSSLEEKNIATKEEIKVIKKKIRELGHEIMSFEFLMRYKSKNPHAFSQQENDSSFWENQFYEHFLYEIDDVKSLTPFTDAQSKIDLLPENPSAKDVDDDTLLALEIIGSESRNVTFLIECEEEIMDQIEADIENYKENDYWEIELDFYEGYVEQSDTLKLLYNICDLLTQLFRLRMFEEFLEIEQEELNKSQVEKTDSTTKNDLNPTKINKTTNDFLIGSDSVKSSLFEFLVKTYSGEKGKGIAIMILALEENKLIAYTENAELYSALRVDFGDIGTNSGINKYLTEVMCLDKEYRKKIALHAEKIKKHIENSPK